MSGKTFFYTFLALSFLVSGAILHQCLSFVLRDSVAERDRVIDFSWEKLPPKHALEWKKCFTGRQCARLIVPLNYSQPDAGEGVIALTRKPALLPSWSKLYRGPILFNPGGPGESGVGLIGGIAGDLFSRILGPQFDIVGFDPRGVGHSTPRASLFKTDFERETWGRKAGPANNSDEGIARTWARNRLVGKIAAENDIDGVLKYINTEQTVRDMLRIVEAHGREKLQYWGFSYGTVLGATFAAMFPDKVERIVIDGVEDAGDYYSTHWSTNLFDTDKALDSFFTGCNQAGPHRCAFWAPTPEDIRRNLTSLFRSLRSNPIPMRTKVGYGLLDYSMLRAGVFESLYNPYGSFKYLAEGLAALATGDAHAIFDALNPRPFQCPCDSSVQRGASFEGDATPTILCNDGDEIPGDLASSEAHFKMLTEISGWGDIWANIRLGCVGWPKFPKSNFRGPFEAKTSHPILLIGNTADPVTPLWAAKNMSRGFPGSVVLVQDSPGHCSISAPSLCTQRHVREYFIFGKLPQPGTVCTPVGTPFSTFSPVLDVPDSERSQTMLTSNMTDEDRDIYGAILQLSHTGVIPHLGFSLPRFRGSTRPGCP